MFRHRTVRHWWYVGIGHDNGLMVYGCRVILVDIVRQVFILKHSFSTAGLRMFICLLGFADLMLDCFSLEETAHMFWCYTVHTAGVRNPHNMLGLLYDDFGRPMPLTILFSTTRSPKHHKHSTRVETSGWALSSEKGSTQSLRVVSFHKCLSSTLTFQKLLSELNAFRRVTVSQKLRSCWNFFTYTTRKWSAFSKN